ncbi:unnamed protein product [Closterium sp. NIES-54]
MEKRIEYLLDRQLIRPSTSPYGAPFLFTPKPDAAWCNGVFKGGPTDRLLPTFQAEMNHILRPLLDKCVVVYMDDILIYSKNMKEHVEHLRKVFEILQENKSYVKLSKSDFALKKVQFLWHMVSAEGIHVDPRKIEVVKKWKVPENVKELQQFLGFANCYNRFMPQYAKIAAPLTNLLKKDMPYKWDNPHRQAMEQLQTALTTAPVLILPDPDKGLRGGSRR